MKTNKFLLMAAIACAAFTSCSTQDNPTGNPTKPDVTVVTFEDQTLNADGYWCGDETGTEFDNWGQKGYNCLYKENSVTFPVNYTPAWASWMGYAISSRTETGYKTLNPDQFNNITGKAYQGKNFCVVQTYGETIDFDAAVDIQGFYFTNNAWTVDAILNGDGMTPGKFEVTDWLKCTVTGTKADATTATVDIMLAQNGTYVNSWQWADLTALGKVVSLSFAFTGTKNNDYGLTTPAYMCIDNLTFIK